MKTTKATLLTEKDFRIKWAGMINDKQTFSVTITRDKNLYMYGEDQTMICRSKKGLTSAKANTYEQGSSIFGNGISQAQGQAVVTMVKQCVKKYVQEVRNVDKVDTPYTTTCKNYRAFEELNKGDIFYSVDINHAYFQVLYRLGYITEKLYDLYKDQDHYKKAFVMSCSLLTSKSKTCIYRKGVLHKIVDSKEEDSVLGVIYDNVRHTLQNLLGGLYEQLGDKAFAYITDEILIRPEALGEVKDYFRGKGYEFKIAKCWKTSNSEYNKANQRTYDIFRKVSPDKSRVSHTETAIHESQAAIFQRIAQRRMQVAV